MKLLPKTVIVKIGLIYLDSKPGKTRTNCEYLIMLEEFRSLFLICHKFAGGDLSILKVCTNPTR